MRTVTVASPADARGIVHGFGTRHDDMARLLPEYWPRRPIQHERHGTRIAIATEPNEDCGEADGMLTDRPGLLLADEPTGNLDPETADGILHLLRAEIRESGAGAIMVTHSHAAAAMADRILVLTRSGLKLM